MGTHALAVLAAPSAIGAPMSKVVAVIAREETTTTARPDRDRRTNFRRMSLSFPHKSCYYVAPFVPPRGPTNQNITDRTECSQPSAGCQKQASGQAHRGPSRTVRGEGSGSRTRTPVRRLVGGAVKGTALGCRIGRPRRPAELRSCCPRTRRGAARLCRCDPDERNGKRPVLVGLVAPFAPPGEGSASPRHPVGASPRPPYFTLSPR